MTDRDELYETILAKLALPLGDFASPAAAFAADAVLATGYRKVPAALVDVVSGCLKDSEKLDKIRAVIGGPGDFISTDVLLGILEGGE
jgi:hypothetical protein